MSKFLNYLYKMIKVFTTCLDANKAGDDLTYQFENWLSSRSIEIIQIHSNSNKFGWMIDYKL